MQFVNTTPEQAGVSAENVRLFLKELNDRGIAMHSLLLSRGSRIFCEAYWKPFCCDTMHRMYSQTKSYVGVAVSQLIAEGKLHPEDKIVDFFPDKLPERIHPYLAAQTVENMLHMQTAFTGGNWFAAGYDREKYYFARQPVRYPGTTFYYDSTGSFILGCLVQRITGKTFLEYLREKCLDRIGFSKGAHCLKAIGGSAWSDSALICTPRDMLRFGRLLADDGKWDGQQLLAPEAVRAAKNTCTDTRDFGVNLSQQKYGRLIWGGPDGSFVFWGIYGQFTLYHPGTDVLFVCTAGYPDNGNFCSELILDKLFERVIGHMQAKPLPVDSGAEQLQCEIQALKLTAATGNPCSGLEEEIQDRIFVPESNPMGITEFSFHFEQNSGEFRYRNAQGRKIIAFGRCTNTPQLFPQKGYSGAVGGEYPPDHQYQCVASAAWTDSHRLSVLVQIIDEYIGLLEITAGFRDGYAVVQMKKSAEDFLKEYEGYMTAQMI